MRDLNQDYLNNESDGFNLKKSLKPYLKQWKWFAISCIFFVFMAFLYLRYTTPEFNAYAKIMLVNEEGGGSPGGVLLKGLEGVAEIEKTVIEDEIEILTSRKLMKRVVERLDLNKQFYAQGRIYDTQFFPNEKSPIKIIFSENDSIINQYNFDFSILVTSETSFDFIYEEEEGKDAITKQYSFGENVSSPIGDILITPNVKNISAYQEQIINVVIVSVNQISEFYSNKILISASGELSKVINLSLDDPSLVRAKAILNTLIDEYNISSIEEKNERANNTAQFIDNRINLIANDLAAVDDEIEQFKTGNKLTNITSEAELYLNSNAQTEQELAANRTEYSMVNYMRDQISDSSFERIPSNVGISDTSINTMAVNYNQLLDDRERLLKSSNEKNPIIVNLDQQISSLKSGLRQSLNNRANTISLRIRSLENQSARMSSKIYSVPGQVRKSKDIEREQGIKETLYLYLLEKREEATISLRSTAPNAKIIDEAHSNGFQVAPKIMFVYLSAILLGMLIPFGFVYVIELLDGKIHNKEDLDEIIGGLPVLGEIAHVSSGDKSLIERNDRSVLSESIRIIRTNFNYIRRGVKNVGKYDNIIFVTSTINGEGKSFVSLNTALTIANTDKRVLLIGADLRNPQILSTIKNKNNKKPNIGLSDYIKDDNLLLGDVITSHSINNLDIDILLSGSIPPNPAELLLGDRVKELFDTVSEQYDIVIVDTAPSMLVTDTLLISEYAGYTIYIVRAGYTEKRILNFAKELHAENKLNKMMFVVNDVKASNFGYGAKYGYYVKPEKKGLFKRRS